MAATEGPSKSLSARNTCISSLLWPGPWTEATAAPLVVTVAAVPEVLVATEVPDALGESLCNNDVLSLWMCLDC